MLLVLDDEDFYVKQKPLTLNHNRAIAAVLCNLAFHSYYKKQTTVSEGAQEWLTIVDQAFPVLLRRLYNRDNRRAFCPPDLWLAPFNQHLAKERSSLVAPAVLRALLHRTGGAFLYRFRRDGRVFQVILKELFQVRQRMSWACAICC